MFFLSQIVEAMLWPANVLIILLVIGVGLLWSGKRSAGRVLVTLATGLLAVFLVFPLDQWLARPLESSFAGPQPAPRHVDGILILSGDFRRVVQSGTIARLYPDARIVYTGGPGILTPTEQPSDYARAYFKGIGINLARLKAETRAEDTWQNLVYSKALVKPKKGETWVLITSAVHMPRAMGVARHLGWTVVPWPVTYISDTDGGTYWRFDIITNLYNTGSVMHEYAALVVYRLRGHTDELFPTR